MDSGGGHEGLRVHLGGKLAVGLFILSLIAFVTETQLTQYVQATLGYRHPLLIFYIVHSSFAIMLPLHFAFLVATSRTSSRALWNGLIFTLRKHFCSQTADMMDTPFPRWRFVRRLVLLTTGATFPGLLWFIAVSLAPITDVTALWNTNAFFAYLLTVRLFKLNWEPLRLAAVILSTLGATAVVYGGSSTSSEGSESSPAVRRLVEGKGSSASAPLAGDLLTLAASILYGTYQVLYKIHAALPNDPEVLDTDVRTEGLYARLPSSHDEVPEEGENLAEAALLDTEMVYPPPFGLYPNLLTSAIGVCTFLVLWIPIPFLHYFHVTRFALPGTSLEVLVIAGIALSGVIFNAGFMILLGVWGPIVTSVGSLLTIVMVFISDVIFGGAVDNITSWSLLGSGAIVTAFAVLAYDMMRPRT